MVYEITLLYYNIDFLTVENVFEITMRFVTTTIHNLHCRVICDKLP